MKRNKSDKLTGIIAAGLAFLSAWGFFLFAYPYHLMRREQLNLFMYDWDYIKETYSGIGWLSHLAGDFVDQFLYFPVLGPAIVALIITGIGIVTYKICRHWIGKWGSLGIAALVFVWSFMRETGNLYITQYSIAVLCYLALILAALQFKKNWLRALAAAAFLATGVLTVGNPYRAYYGKMWGKPTYLNEKLIALDVNVARENWDKVIKLSKKEDLYLNEACYFFNVATAKKGIIGDEYFNHSQNYMNGIFLFIEGNQQFIDGAAGELWYHIGDMTIAEQSAIIGLQFSPKHTGARFIKRMAEITMISGDDVAAQKYLNMLSRTLIYRKWALSMLPENRSAETEKWLSDARSNLIDKDTIYYGAEAYEGTLKELLKVNPDNMMARQYLLMYYLIRCDLDNFIEYYGQKTIPGALYEQAALIWLNANDAVTDENMAKYGISEATSKKIQQFYQSPNRYANTYWYYYADLMFGQR
ncbi:MAG: DUF6057 family protein [Bacteroidia bacterium]|nr:DUF6057 family protein [Bacteroidia bacterium]